MAACLVCEKNKAALAHLPRVTMLAALVAVGPTAQPMQPEAEPVPPVLNVLHERRELIERLTGETLHVKSGAASCPVGVETFKDLGQQPGGGLHLAKLKNHSTYYVHVHKSGGTAICRLAEVNGEVFDEFASAEHFKHNCNCKGDGPDAEVNEWALGYDRSCEERAQLKSSFQMVERWVDTHTCGASHGMARAIMIRDPLDRIISAAPFEAEVHAHVKTRELVKMVMRSIQPGAMHALEEPEALKGTHMIGYGTAAWDNFLTRTLGGPDVFRLPARSLNATHLEHAKQKLSNFEIVMMLDEFDTDSAQLSHILGWQALVVEEHLPAQRLPRAEHTTNPFSEEQLRELAEVNKLDMELVCFARALARERTARATTRGHSGAGYELEQRTPVGGRPDPAV